MQLIDFLQDETLNALRVTMQAPLIDISDLPYQNGISYADIFDLYDGFELPLDKIEVKDNGLFYHKGVLVTLSIQDINKGTSGEQSLPRLHITKCHTLQEMEKGGRIKRYITSCRDDTKRKIRFISNQSYISSTRDYNLDVCRFCLAKIRWQGYWTGLSYRAKDEIVDRFNLAEFYKQHEPQFYSDFKGVLFNEGDVIPVNQYQSGWKLISYQYRKSKKWRCEACAKDCSQNHAELHVHHINGNKADNTRINLSALCYNCHAKQPFHEHMR